jgi:hypothetical protein
MKMPHVVSREEWRARRRLVWARRTSVQRFSRAANPDWSYGEGMTEPALPASTQDW